MAATCRFASPASIVSMKLQSATRRRAERSHKAGGDYLDIFRLLSYPTMARPIAEAFRAAPHDLGDWSAREIRSRLVDDAARIAAVIARSGVGLRQTPSAEEIRAAGHRFGEVWDRTG